MPGGPMGGSALSRCGTRCVWLVCRGYGYRGIMKSTWRERNATGIVRAMKGVLLRRQTKLAPMLFLDSGNGRWAQQHPQQNGYYRAWIFTTPCILHTPMAVVVRTASTLLRAIVLAQRQRSECQSEMKGDSFARREAVSSLFLWRSLPPIT